MGEPAAGVDREGVGARVKWADYCISKFGWEGTQETRIERLAVHDDLVDKLGQPVERSRAWVIKELQAGRTFALVDKNEKGLWSNPEALRLSDDGGLHYARKLPVIGPATKVFTSFYHKDDEAKRQSFDHLTADLFTNKSVGDGDIDSGLSDDYIKQLIQRGYLHDTTVLVLLLGPNTRHRMHVDWEIAGALEYRVGDRYAGLLGLLLPTHPDFGEGRKVTYASLPARFAANLRTGYAVVDDWTSDRRRLQQLVQTAFDRRSNTDKIENRSVPRMVRDTGP